MSSPTISVITVTRNLIEAGRTQSMADALECVQGQTCRVLEHVILDGASTDGTQALIEDRIAAGGAVPVRFLSEPDSGLYDAMNKAVEIASGDYVVFLNSDDLIARPDSLARMQAHLARACSDYAFGETIYADAAGNLRHSRRLTTKGILQSIPFCHNSTLIRRAAFRELGGHDLSFRIVADYDMVLRLMLQGYRGSAAQVPISVFRLGGLSSDLHRTAAEMIRAWRKNYQPFVDMTVYSDEECLDWFRIGQLPLRVSTAILLAFPGNAVVHRAALYSIAKTVRRRLQPWRRWDNLSAG